MFIVGRAVVDDAVGETAFCCDLPVCKGACCCLPGGRGAPLEDDEVLEIEKAYPAVRGFLPEGSIAVIASAGMVDGQPGSYATNCVEGRECVFAYFEDGIARCSFERAYLEGTIAWRKPISCHLFPVRVRTFGEDFLHYEIIHECEGGRKRGRTDKISLHAFLKEPLIRRYGREWYGRFLRHCSMNSEQK
jgi:hypothetical protein